MRYTSFCTALALSLSLGLTTFVQAADSVATNGTHLYTTMDQRISSKTSHTGDVFSLTVKDGFFHKNPANLVGATVDGHIENVEAAGPTHKSTLSLIFDDVKLSNGKVTPLHAKLESLKAVEPKTHHVRDAGIIVGGAVVGHIMGSHHGIKHGGLAGAAAGFALVSTMKSDITINRGSQITLKLTSDLVPTSTTSGM